MTYWGDTDRIKKINSVLRDIRHDLGIIERILRHMGTRTLTDTRSRPVGPLDEAVRLNRGVSGEGDE